MTKQSIQLFIAVLLLVLVTLFWPAHRAETKTSGADAKHDAHSEDGGGENPQEKKRKIKYWVAPMDPNYIRQEPGKSPMGMDLIPVYEDEGEKSAEGVVKIDPVTVQNIGVRTASLSKGVLEKKIRAVGRITYDEKLVEHIHTKVSGWIDGLYVDTTGEAVVKGDALLSFYAPELVATQEEFLQALAYRDRTAASGFPEIAEGGKSFVEAARNRLLFMDVAPGDIEILEKTREVQKNMKLYASKGGVVINKNVIDGMQVDPRMELYTIADISRVWVIASVYEYELPFIGKGQEAEMTLSYEPGAQYKGRVTFIYPYLSTKTRTVEVRMEFDNPDLKLKPDMYADVVINARSGTSTILVPSEAVIRTGSRNIIVTALGKGKFLPKEVKLGLEGEGFVQVLKGVEEDDTVVTSGQFLIDSESNLREAVNKMLEAQAAQPSPGKEDRQAMTQGPSSRSPVHLSDGQKNLITVLIGNYLKIHAALISESGPAIAQQSSILSDTLKKIKASTPKGTLKDVIASAEESMPGLLSEDLQDARNSFKGLSRAMVDLVRADGREEALSSGIKIYFCPMEEERWLQEGTDLKNPYLGKDMWICGTEEAL